MLQCCVRLSVVVCLSVTLCIVAKRCVLEQKLLLIVGTCESFFFVRIESRIESAGAQTTVVYTLHLQRIFNPSVFCICDEREWCTDYGTPNWVFVYFNSVIKRVKQCCCTLILLPKSTLNANLTTTNRFFTNDDWQRGRFENFESDHQYESNLESDVRFEINIA